MEWPLPVPRRGRRPELRSLGPVLTYGSPVSFPKLQMGGRVASTARTRPANAAGRNGLAPIFAFASKSRACARKYSARWGELPYSKYQPTPASYNIFRAIPTLQISSQAVLSGEFDTPQPHQQPGSAERDLGLPRTAALAQGRHLCQVDAAWRGGHARAPSWSPLLRDPGWHSVRRVCR